MGQKVRSLKSSELDRQTDRQIEWRAMKAEGERENHPSCENIHKTQRKVHITWKMFSRLFYMPCTLFIALSCTPHR